MTDTSSSNSARAPGAGWRAAEIRVVAREAEEAGFDSIFTAEVNSDALATAQLMAEATRLTRDFENDLAQSRRINYDEWKNRPVGERVFEKVGWFFQRQQ